MFSSVHGLLCLPFLVNRFLFWCFRRLLLFGKVTYLRLDEGAGGVGRMVRSKDLRKGICLFVLGTTILDVVAGEGC